MADRPTRGLLDQIMALLEDVRPEGDFASSNDFLEDGLLDSTDVLLLVAGLDETYGISIEGTDILPEHFKHADAIARLVRKYGAGS